MGEALGQVAIVGQEEEPFGLGIEPADVEETWQMRRQKIEDGIAGLGIAPGRNKPGRLMQHDIEPALAVNELAVDLDVVALRRLRAEIGADLTVDGHATVGDQRITMPPRTEPGRGEKTVQAHWKS